MFSTVLALTLFILVIFALLIHGLCKASADADEQAERDYALMKVRRNLQT